MIDERKLYHQGVDYQLDQEEIPMGRLSSYSLTNDPKHLAFVLSRYKFCAKMLKGKDKVLEIGSGDGIGLPLIAQEVGYVYCIDWDERLVEGIKRRLLKYIKNAEVKHLDINNEKINLKVDAAFSIDFLEHVNPDKEKQVLENIVECLPKSGVLITGMPSKSSQQYATPRSKVQHINLKTSEELRELMSKYFENVFMFGMNDEVLHTGYGPMCHYIWSVACGKK